MYLQTSLMGVGLLVAIARAQSTDLSQYVLTNVSSSDLEVEGFADFSRPENQMEGIPSLECPYRLVW